MRFQLEKAILAALMSAGVAIEAAERSSCSICCNGPLAPSLSTSDFEELILTKKLLQFFGSSRSITRCGY